MKAKDGKIPFVDINIKVEAPSDFLMFWFKIEPDGTVSQKSLSIPKKVLDKPPGQFN